MKSGWLILFLSFALVGLQVKGQSNETKEKTILDKNKQDRVDWLRDAGFGMFIHFGIDSQLGIVISHSLVGASDDYVNRYFNELPKTFNPSQFDPYQIAVLAKLAGMKYIVLTTKHHSGFCMWNTKTTDFNIMNTPYGQDLVAQYVAAVRKTGLAVGFYYSPEDFHFLHENGQVIRRRFPTPLPADLINKYVSYTEKQCTELMSNYGKIDVIFFDGGEGPLQEKAKETVWKLQPDILVTRGALKTPEQTLPGQASNEVFESCITMGTQWQYKPTNEEYKSGARLIELLIETRAKGGALLLNVGPKPDGELPIDQESRLREMAAWNFINHEAIEDVEPWILTHEDNIWFTQKPDQNTVYAFITGLQDWAKGDRKEFVLRSVQSTDRTKVSVLGQSDKVVEYDPKVDATTTFEQKQDGLNVSCVRAQRIYNNSKWPNPVVLKLEGVKPALDPPLVQTLAVKQSGNKLQLTGRLEKTGNLRPLEVGFYYRRYAGFVEELYNDAWNKTPFIQQNTKGEFHITIDVLEPGVTYQFKAAVRNPKIEIQGDVIREEMK